MSPATAMSEGSLAWHDHAMPSGSGTVPLRPPIEPMLAKPLPKADLAALVEVSFEPKWDGFRCLVFKRGDHVVLQGRGRGRGSEPYVDLAYAFPELVGAMRAQLPVSCVIDGEIVLIVEGRLDFSGLGARLRPRSEAGTGSIDRLAAQSPASFFAFDILDDSDGVVLMDEPLRTRRQRLVGLAESWAPPLYLTPNTTDPVVAAEWFHQLEGAGIDGLIVKADDDPYLPGKRTQGKVKHERTIDVVVAGMRVGADKSGQQGITSLLLGLYDDDRRLQYMGVSSAFSAEARRQMYAELSALRTDGAHPWVAAPPEVRIPGAVNRWSKGSDVWLPLQPERVAEVAYDQLEQGRFRHVAGFVRWRPDRQPDSCTFEQIAAPGEATVDDLLAYL